MNPKKIRRKIQELSGVVSVRLESDGDTTQYRVKFAKRFDEESRAEKHIQKEFDLERIDSFENSSQQLILRFS